MGGRIKPKSLIRLLRNTQSSAGFDFCTLFDRHAFLLQIKRTSLSRERHYHGDYVEKLLNDCELEKMPPETRHRVRDLRTLMSYHLYMEELLTYCERDTVLKLYGLPSLNELPGEARNLQPLLNDHLRPLVSRFYTIVAQIINNGEPLTKRQHDSLNTTCIHIINVYTSLLQMYYLVGNPGERILKINAGSITVQDKMLENFRNFYGGNEELDFMKWAFIVLFHDIGKFQEDLPGSTRKHDEISAELIQEWGILDNLKRLSPDEKDEILLIIGTHLFIGCHAPADHAMTRLDDVLDHEKAASYLTEAGANILHDRVCRFNANSLIMWIHDAAGYQRGLATAPPFEYMERLFNELSGILKGKNRKDRRVIQLAIERMARKEVKRRILRIVGAWDFRAVKQDHLHEEPFDDALAKLVKDGDLSKDDRDSFFRHFFKISGANHIFNMLVYPVRQNEGYGYTAKGMALLTKAAVLLQLNEIRAINEQGTMETDGTRRDDMAAQLRDAVEYAYTVRQRTDGEVEFVDKAGEPISTAIRMYRYEDLPLGTSILMVQIPIEV